MKLIKQSLLAFQGGNSDKVYEVDLCEVGNDQYVVNFRYGRRGTTLTEGSKTPLPVNRAKADKVFDSLVQSKLKKGYYDTAADAPAVASQAVEILAETDLPAAAVVQDPRAQAVLARLAAHFQVEKSGTASLLSLFKKGKPKAATPSKPWALDRAIWRAGELRIAQAEPYLLRLITPADHERNYCIVYALGRCGSDAALAPLQRFYESKGLPDMLRRLAGAALWLRLPETERAALQAQLLAALPQSIRDAGADSDRLNAALDDWLKADKPESFEALTLMYQASVSTSENPASPQQNLLRSKLLNILRDAPLRPPFFKRLRHIFKLAEYLEDFEVFALLAYRFEKDKAMFRASPWGGVATTDEHGRYRYLRDEELQRALASPKAKLAYSEKTRHYLRRRVWRTLRRLGEAANAQYVAAATQVLLRFSDADGGQLRSHTTHQWLYESRSWQSHTTHWDLFASYWCFNHILYHHSPRYQPSGTYHWRCRDDYQPGGAVPAENEAAFPALWQQHPAKLLHLLQHSHCRPVHEFAAKTLRSCPAFCAALPLDLLIGLLHSLYLDTAQLAFELAQAHYNPAQPQRELVLAALSCVAPAARQAAQEWVRQGRAQILQDSEFLSQLLGNEHADIRTFAQHFLQSASLNDTVAQALLGRMVSELLAMPAEHGERATDISNTLRQLLGPQLRLLGMPVLADLIRAHLLPAQLFAADILLNYHAPTAIPETLLHSLLEAEHDSLRAIAMRILAHFNHPELIQRAELLAVLAARPHTEVRVAAFDLIQTLLPQHDDFAKEITLLLVGRLTQPTLTEETASDLAKLLKQSCAPYWTSLPQDSVWRLLRAHRNAAQEIGGLLLPICTRPEDFSIKQLVKLADHDILSVRQAAQQMCLAQLPRLRNTLFVTVKLLDAQWTDSREFALKLFKEHFSKEQLTPDILVSICDSVKPDVQQFGRTLLTQYFNDTDGADYLLKLSEHPGHEMQLFATHYLERFACDNPERLQSLTPYFLSLLSRVNKGKIAKQRVYHFLATEALKSPHAAAIIAPILTRQSATIAIGDKAATLRIMAQIRQNYPEITLPLQVG